MERSSKFPNLSRYCFAWEWLAQFRVYKPAKQKKEWIDWAEGLLAEDAAECRRLVARHCQEKGWKLRELYFVKPYRLAFCFDRDAPGDEFLSPEEQRNVCPTPAAEGIEWKPKTAAQLQQEKAQARERQRLQQQFPLLADILAPTL
ncbi:hypothetical protein IC235_11225 [Hymenobacter sp. BT664]|uniref:Uncharacterized protein n=1 Tax=Hymenobacter montanus TaxID=2771359 RepID=A0A927GJU0_9BACT|nr:hypothetical protein [Hymenobacter montanus]MBD2768461.1 hypothetical protein [Hymenobacter montanus]